MGLLVLCAVLIADLAGFSALCEREGIEAGIARVTQFRDLAVALVNSHAGTWVKGWADNIAAVFPSVAQAHHCGEVLTRLVPCSVGIGWGDVVLDRPPGDLWGVEVNRASRLGEDVAGAGEILLTEAAQAAL